MSLEGPDGQCRCDCDVSNGSIRPSQTNPWVLSGVPGSLTLFLFVIGMMSLSLQKMSSQQVALENLSREVAWLVKEYQGYKASIRASLKKKAAKSMREGQLTRAAKMHTWFTKILTWAKKVREEKAKGWEVIKSSKKEHRDILCKLAYLEDRRSDDCDCKEGNKERKEYATFYLSSSIPASFLQVLHLMSDTSRAEEFNRIMDLGSIQETEEIDCDTKCVTAKTKHILVLRPRKFATVVQRRWLAEGGSAKTLCLIHMAHDNHPDVTPPFGRALSGAMFLSPDSSGQACRLDMLFQLDMNIPKFLQKQLIGIIAPIHPFKFVGEFSKAAANTQCSGGYPTVSGFSHIGFSAFFLEDNDDGGSDGECCIESAQRVTARRYTHRRSASGIRLHRQKSTRQKRNALQERSPNAGKRAAGKRAEMKESTVRMLGKTTKVFTTPFRKLSGKQDEATEAAIPRIETV